MNFQIQKHRLIFFLFIFSACSKSNYQEAGNEKPIEIFTEKGKNGEVKFYCHNRTKSTYLLYLDINAQGYTSNINKNKAIKISPSLKRVITTLIPFSNLNNYRYSYRYFRENMSSEMGHDFIYELPVSSENAILVNQGNNGQFSHKNINALDIVLPIGIDVLAMRGGEVVSVKEDSQVGCPRKICADLANYVKILHDDETYAEYYHLDYNSVLVEIGDTVQVSQVLAKSGNTGFSSGPHLHVQINEPNTKYEKGKSIKVKFKTTEGVIYIDEPGIYNEKK